MDEQSLISNLAKGDGYAFTCLYRHYSAAMFGCLKLMVKNQEVAEELLSDLFLKVREHIGSYDCNKGRLFTWMITIARRMAIDKMRTREFRISTHHVDLDSIFEKADRRRSEMLEIDEIGLDTAVDVLSVEQKFIIHCLYNFGYTHSEIAEEFKIPLGTVKTRARAALHQLRLYFQGEVQIQAIDLRRKPYLAA